MHSSTKFYERYSDKNLRFFSLQRDIRWVYCFILIFVYFIPLIHSLDTLCSVLQFFTNFDLIRETKDQISMKVQDTVEKKRLREEIKQMKTKLKHIKHLIRAKTERKVQTELNLQKLKSSNMKRIERLPEYVSKVEKMRVSHEKFRNDHVRNKQTELGDDQFELSQIR